MSVKINNRTYSSKSAAIRSLANLRMKRSKIATVVGVREQMVHNIIRRSIINKETIA